MNLIKVKNTDKIEIQVPRRRSEGTADEWEKYRREGEEIRENKRTIERETFSQYSSIPLNCFNFCLYSYLTTMLLAHFFHLRSNTFCTITSSRTLCTCLPCVLIAMFEISAFDKTTESFPMWCRSTSFSSNLATEKGRKLVLFLHIGEISSVASTAYDCSNFLGNGSSS